MKKNILERLQKAAKKKVKIKPSDKAKVAMEKRAAKSNTEKKKKKAKKSNRPSIDIAQIAKGSKCFAAPKKAKKAIEPWQLSLLKTDLKR